MKSFDHCLINLPASLWHYIAQIGEIKGQRRYGAVLGPQLLGRLKRYILVTSTGTEPVSSSETGEFRDTN